MGTFDFLTKNPSLIALAALGIGLFIFRDKISGFFSDVTGGTQAAATLGSNFNSNLQGIQDITTGISEFIANPLGDFEFPTFELPSFELPSFEFPTFQLPDFGSIIGGSGDITETPAAIGRASDRGRIIPVPEPIPIFTTGDQGSVFVAPVDEFGIGGGPSFIGGTTTFGDNIVDSLSEVLALFPSLTASQARDALEQNQGLTASQFRLTEPDVLNLTEPDQTFNNSSGGFSGLTPQQIFSLISGL